MFPFDWNAGEAPIPEPHTFKKFQDFFPEALEVAAKKIEGHDFNHIFDYLQQNWVAANDNEHPVGDQVVLILLSAKYMSMLQCWIDCGRDMVLTKLTWRDSDVA